MFCPYCGNKIYSKDTFCENCGKKIQSDEKEIIKPFTINWKIIAIFVVLLLVIVVGLVLANYFYIFEPPIKKTDLTKDKFLTYLNSGRPIECIVYERGIEKNRFYARNENLRIDKCYNSDCSDKLVTIYYPNEKYLLKLPNEMLVQLGIKQKYTNCTWINVPKYGLTKFTNAIYSKNQYVDLLYHLTDTSFVCRHSWSLNEKFNTEAKICEYKN